MPRKPGMERKDLLKANCRIFQAQGKAMDQFAKKTIKVHYFFIFSRTLWVCLFMEGGGDTEMVV